MAQGFIPRVFSIYYIYIYMYIPKDTHLVHVWIVDSRKAMFHHSNAVRGLGFRVRV